MKLDPRQMALLVWATIGVVALVAAAARDGNLRGNLWDLAKTAAQPKLLALFGTFGVWMLTVTVAASRASLWTSALLVDTLILVFTTGVLAVGRAVSLKTESFWTNVAKPTVEAGVLVAFVLNMFTPSFWWEFLLIQPAIVTLALIAALGGDNAAGKVGRAGLSLIAASLLAFAAWKLATDWQSIDEALAVRQLVLELWIPVAVVPFAALAALISAYEYGLIRMRAGGGAPLPGWKLLIGLSAELWWHRRRLAQLNLYESPSLASSDSVAELRARIRRRVQDSSCEPLTVLHKD